MGIKEHTKWSSFGRVESLDQIPEPIAHDGVLHVVVPLARLLAQQLSPNSFADIFDSGIGSLENKENWFV
jgi:hypothetical protein